MHYQFTNGGGTILRHNDDGTVSHIPMSEQNEDYKEYLVHVEGGGETQPYEGWIDPEAPIQPDEVIE
jgi:hypothetical protein